MKAVVLMATPCTKSLGGESGGHGEKWIARKHYQFLDSPQACRDTALVPHDGHDDCDDGEEVSRVGLQYPQHLTSCTITLAHTLTPSHTVRCLDRSTA